MSARRVLSVLLILLIAAAAWGKGEKEYQTGKLLDTNSRRYSDIVSNSSTGTATSVGRMENRLLIQVGDIIYLAECVAKNRWSKCKAGDFVVGDPVELRIEKDNLYLKRGSGELKLKIIQRRREAKEQQP